MRARETSRHVRIAYIVHFRGGNETGVYRKVAYQADEWERQGAKVGLFVATSPAAVEDWRALPQAVRVRTPPAGSLGKLRERRSLVQAAGRWRADLVYERNGLWYPSFSRIPRVLEVNSDELAEFRLTSRPRAAYCAVTRPLHLGLAAGLVFVTEELARMQAFTRYRRSAIVVANGIRLADLAPLPPAQNPTPRLVFMGHPRTAWPGLEHVVEMARLFPTWTFDLIGPCPDEGADAPANVVAYGVLGEADYLPILAVADVAISTLGLYRKGMQEASPLKTREYLGRGLPTIIGYRDTDFPGGAPFLLQLPDTPDGVARSGDRIAAFVDVWRGRRVDRSAIAHLDVGDKERLRLRFLGELAGQSGSLHS